MGGFFSRIGTFMKESLRYNFEEVPRFIFEDVPKLLWAIPILIKNLLEAIVYFGRNILRAFEIFIRSIFTFIGAFMKLIGGFFRVILDFFKIF